MTSVKDGWRKGPLPCLLTESGCCSGGANRRTDRESGGPRERENATAAQSGATEGAGGHLKIIYILGFKWARLKKPMLFTNPRSGTFLLWRIFQWVVQDSERLEYWLQLK